MIHSKPISNKFTFISIFYSLDLLNPLKYIQLTTFSIIEKVLYEINNEIIIVSG
jgi:hypothetical protein